MWFLSLLTVSVVRGFQRQWRRARFAAKGVKISRDVIVDCDPNCELSIAKGCSVGLGTLLIVKSQGAMLGSLRIGDDTAINEYNNIRAAGGTIEIGRNCQIAQFCSIVATNHTTETNDYMIRAPWNPEKAFVLIEDDVWIGANVVILPGVKIGSGAVIGAGSVVTKDIPAYSICAGVPARVIRLRTQHA